MGKDKQRKIRTSREERRIAKQLIKQGEIDKAQDRTTLIERIRRKLGK